MNIYILGGGCYGLQYARWLLAARARRKIDFEHLIVVDRDSNCAVSAKIKDPLVRLVAFDWIYFLTDYAGRLPARTDDLVVPSHAAPHVLGMVFLELIKSQDGKGRRVSVETADTRVPVGTPYEWKREKGITAVSMATWNCPANCPEPGKCPHIHAPRDWDLEMTLRSWAETVKLDDFFVFPARHYAFAVSAIPMQSIIDAWRTLQTRLQTAGEYMIGVATSSACHGILSIFRVKVGE